MNDLVPRLSAVVIECADPWKLGDFWQQLIGGSLEPDESGEVVELRGGTVPIDFVQVPDAKDGRKSPLHLDLSVPPEVKTEAVDRAVALGATRADDIYDGGLWQVLRDPEGNVFCLVWGGA
jgi:hypothetical protein